MFIYPLLFLYKSYYFIVNFNIKNLMKKIYLIDWNSFIYRMFFALPEFSTKDWKVVNALFWMAKFFVSSLVKQNPDYIVFVKDAHWENFRHKIYSDYKATRDRMPDNLRTQIWDIETMIAKMWIDIVEIPWYEADDVIWTLSIKLWEDKNNDIYILTWDKDLYSLITENVSVYDTMKRKIYNPEKAKEKFWVEPKQIIDYLAIVWDKADNIPGIDWFWPKKAVDLINIIGSIDEIFKEVDLVKSEEKVFSDFEKSIQSYFKWKTFEKLANSHEDAFLSKKLATIELNMNLPDFNLEEYKFKPDFLLNEETVEFFKENEFHSLLWEWDVAEMKTWESEKLEVYIIDNDENLLKLFESVSNSKEIVLNIKTTSDDIMKAEVAWVWIYINDKKNYYINRMHDWNKVTDIALKGFLSNIFALEDLLIIWHNIKFNLEIIDLYLNKSINDLSIELNRWQTSLLL